MEEELRNIHRQVLPNGLTIISEEMKHIRSVSIGIWIKTGSRDEEPKSNGISHFIEHMVFKARGPVGGSNRPPGGFHWRQLDAFTAKSAWLQREGAGRAFPGRVRCAFGPGFESCIRGGGHRPRASGNSRRNQDG